MTSMYLSSDAKLWWSTRVGGDKESSKPQITTWEILKKKIKEQVLPSNSSWMAQESLKHLKQMGVVREYVKEFNSLMLEIKNTSNDDKMFNFISGLQD